MFLEIFALIILIIVAAAIIGIWLFLAMLPGKTARKRNHPQADAINVCGWVGAIAGGVIWPVAIVWAYTNPRGKNDSPESAPQEISEKKDAKS